MFRPGDNNRLNKLTQQAVLPEGWHKVGPGLWRHDNGEESKVNPAAMFTNSNFSSLKVADSPEGQRPPAERLAPVPTVGSGPGVAPPPPPRPPPPPPPPSSAEVASSSTVAPPPPPPAKSEKWYYIGYDDAQHGPFSAEEMSRLYDVGHVQAMSYVWTGGSGGWMPLKDSSLQYVPAAPSTEGSQRQPPSPRVPPPPPPPPPRPPSDSDVLKPAAPSVPTFGSGRAEAGDSSTAKAIADLATEHLQRLGQEFVLHAAGDGAWMAFAIEAQQRALQAWQTQAEAMLRKARDKEEERMMDGGWM